MQSTDRRLWILVVAVGVLLGIGLFTFGYAEGLSYFSTDPAACTNCHIMQSQYDSWLKASHHDAATCVDCHLPHTFVAKYIAKAQNGYYHSKGFTFQDFHEPIQITRPNKEILQDNCLGCHDALVHELVTGATTDDDAIDCIHCHRTAGHGESVGLGGPEDTAEVERLLQEALVEPPVRPSEIDTTESEGS